MEKFMHKIKLIIFLTVILFYSSSVFTQPVNTPKEEVNFLIMTVERHVTKIKQKSPYNYIKSEIEIIEKHIKEARSLFKKGIIDQSFYEISIANAYFKLIKAKISNHRATKDLENTKKILGK